MRGAAVVYTRACYSGLLAPLRALPRRQRIAARRAVATHALIPFATPHNPTPSANASALSLCY